MLELSLQRNLKKKDTYTAEKRQLKLHPDAVKRIFDSCIEEHGVIWYNIQIVFSKSDLFQVQRNMVKTRIASNLVTLNGVNIIYKLNEHCHWWPDCILDTHA